MVRDRQLRRIFVVAGGTVAGVAAVFAYPTSTGRALPEPEAGTTSAAAATPAVDEPTAEATSPSGSASTPASDSASASQSASASASGSTDTPTTAASGLSDGTFSASSTMQYGTVTVTVTVQGGVVTDASGSQSSPDQKSQQISSRAIPVLDEEAVSAQSASIALVSHATYTSEAYAQSLQQAIDQAYAG